MLKVLLTGASGCVGHYIAEALIHNTNYELFLLVRNPIKLKLDCQIRPGITVIPLDMLQIEQIKDLLSSINIAILTATVWGGEDVYRVNVDKTHELISYLQPGVCQHILYFSTASILDRHLQLLPQAGEIGTDYIRSKYLCLQKLEADPLAQQITVLFPTLVFGGDGEKPYSQLSAGLPQILPWTGLLRFFQAEGTFHFIHGQDIAAVVLYLINHPEASRGKRLVLGNAEVSVNQCIQTLCAFQNLHIYLQIPLYLWLARVVIKLFHIRMAAWDYFCLNYRYFGYDAPINPSSFGLEAYCPTLEDVLKLNYGDRQA